MCGKNTARRGKLAADQPTFLIVLGPGDFATCKPPIENVYRCRASFADGRPIRHPDDNGCQRQKNEQND